jgi:hypothetical protein
MAAALAFSVTSKSVVTKEALKSSIHLALSSAKCIASNDPRLMEK